MDVRPSSYLLEYGEDYNDCGKYVQAKLSNPAPECPQGAKTPVFSPPIEASNPLKGLAFQNVLR
jgi:hypothetical protein